MVPTIPLPLKPFTTNNIQSSAPSNHVNDITNIPLSTLPNIDLPSIDLSSFKIPEIPHGAMNHLPLPSDFNQRNNNNKIALMPTLPIPITNHQTSPSTLPLPLPSISNIHSVALPTIPAFPRMPTISTMPTIPTMPALPTMPTIPLNPTLPTTLALSPKKLSLPKMSTLFSKAIDTKTKTKTRKKSLKQDLLSPSSPQPRIDTAPQTPSTRNHKAQLSIPTPIPNAIRSDLKPKSNSPRHNYQHNTSIPSKLSIKPSEVEIKNKTQEILAMYGINSNRKRKRELENDSNNISSRPRRSKAATSRKRQYTQREPQIFEDEVSSEDDQDSDEYLPDDLRVTYNHNHNRSHSQATNHNHNHRRNQCEEKNSHPQIAIDDIDKVTTSNTTDSNSSSLPLGHPARITYKDTISEGFTEKYKNKKRAVCHRTWARSKKCKDCKITYPSADDYELHRMVYHSEGIQMIHECPVCSTQYNERRWLNRHVRNSHFKFLCKIDGHGINHEGKSNAQLKKKKGKKAKASDIDNICGFRFSSKQDLSAHQAIYHGVTS